MRQRGRLIVGVVAGVLVLAGATAALGGSQDTGLAQPGPHGAVISHGACPAEKTDWVASDASAISTTSTTPVNVSGMSRRFRVGGSHPSCVIVEFAAYAFAPNPALMYVRAVMGTTVATPGETQFEGDSNTYATTHQYTFVFPDVNPGRHRVTIQFRSFDGTNVFLHHPVMTILHG